jgi:hypothetical protein
MKQMKHSWGKRVAAMKETRGLLVLACLGILAVPAGADDLVAPPWTRYLDNPEFGVTTFQQWEFGDANDTPPPDDVFMGSIYTIQGGPSLLVNTVGEDTWLASWEGRDGVWPLSGSMDIDIQNWPEVALHKWLQIQLTWSPTFYPPVPSLPTIYIEAMGHDQALIPQEQIYLREQSDIDLPGDWVHTTYLYEIVPNPLWERIMIGGTITVDEVVIDTICTPLDIPEPGTLALVAVGSMGLLRRAKKG